MKKGLLKKSAAWMLAATMMISMAGCGKSGDGDKKSDSGKESVDTKEMVYAGEDFIIDGMKGDPSTIYIQGDKMYISTYEWIEGEGASENSENEEDAENPSVDDDETVEENGEEAVKDEESNGEDEASNENSEENSDEENSEEETSGEENGEEAEEENAEFSEDEEMPEGTEEDHLYSVSLDGSDLKELAMPEKEENEWLSQVFVRQDGTFVFLYNSYDEKKETSSYFIVQADENGKVSSKEDVSESLNLGQDSYVSKVLLDDKENVVFVTDKSVLVLGIDGKQVCELKAENNVYLDGAAKTKDGQIVVGFSGEEGACIQILDVDGKKWGEKYSLSLQYFNGDSLMNGSDGYDVYYKNDTGIFGYTFADKKETQILDYMASNISTENTYNIMPFTEGKFIGSTWEESGSKMVVYSKVDPSTIKDKQTISMAMMWVDDQIKKAAMDFNKNNDKYQIEIKDYSNEEEPITKMNADIVAGNIADIICLSYLPVEQYVEKGILEDLTPYFDKDDEISTDDIVDSLREAMEVDGKLYYVTPTFNVSTLTASSKDVGTQMGWTFEDFKKLLDEKGKDVRPFYSENKSDMLYSLAWNATTDFVDWTTGECSFDSQDFKDILEICNRGSNEEMEYNEDSPSMPKLIQEGKILFSEGAINLQEIQVNKALFKDGITFIGYPDAEKQGSYFSIDSSLGIYSKSDVKDGAWEFIRTFMTKEYQGKELSDAYYWNSPSRKDALELSNQIAMATEKFTDEYGNEHEPVESSSAWDNDFEVKIGPSSQEDVDMFMDLINNTKKINAYDDSVLNIIIEESKAYFSGDKSVDETADVIQNRVKTYVNENR